MEDGNRTRESTVVRVDECCRFEDELWRRAYERLLPPIVLRRQEVTQAEQDVLTSRMAWAKGA